jgi:hypothetical protein
MKNQIKPIIAALLLGTVFFANAKTLPSEPTIKPYAMSMYKNDGKPTFNVFVNKLEGTKLKLVLKDSEGAVIYDEILSKKSTEFRTKFNMADLKKGTYTLEIIDGKNVEVKKVEI